MTLRSGGRAVRILAAARGPAEASGQALGPARIHSPPRTVEIAGLAGAGKSTVAALLCDRSARVTPAARLRMDRPRHASYCALRAVRLLPLLARTWAAERAFTRDEVKWLLYLSGWDRVLDRQRTRERPVVVLDQGPLFYLATLGGFGPSTLRESTWWEATLDRWASTLDLVFWLEAPEEVLISRIRDRGKPHPLKQASRGDARGFLAAYRSSYDRVMIELVDRGGPEVRRFDTSRETPVGIATAIASSWGERLEA